MANAVGLEDSSDCEAIRRVYRTVFEIYQCISHYTIINGAMSQWNNETMKQWNNESMEQCQLADAFSIHISSIFKES